jgi:hypothetical protein
MNTSSSHHKKEGSFSCPTCWCHPADRFIIIWEQRAAGMPSSAPFGSEAVKVSHAVLASKIPYMSILALKTLHIKDQSGIKW